MGMNAQQIADTINSGPGPKELFGEGKDVKDLAKKHGDVVDRIEKLQKRMKGSWKGKAADAAYVGAGPLTDASKFANEHMSSASKLYEGQGDSFNTVKSKVGDGPGPKPLDTQAPASLPSSGPQLLDSPGLDKWYEKSQHIVDAYKNYKSESKDNADNWPKDYGKLGLPDGGKDFHVANADGNGGGDGSKGYVSAPGPGGGPESGTPGGLGGSSGSGDPRGAGDTSGTVDGSATGPSGGTHSGSEVPAAGDTSTSTSGFTRPGDSAGEPGHPGSTHGPGSGTGYGSGTGSGSGSGHGHGSGAAPGYGAVAGSGNSGGFGPRGSAGGNSSGSTGTPGGAPRSGSSTGSGTGGGSGSGNAAPGKSSGVGSPREAAGPVRGAAAATGGSGGNTAGGRGMMPGMGGAGRGQGGDDETHERPTFLEEPDSDGLFGPDPDDKTVPPVIGL